MNFKNLLFVLAFIISSAVVAATPDAFEEQISQIVQHACDQKELLKGIAKQLSKVVDQDLSKDALVETIYELLEQNRSLKAKLAQYK